MSGANSLIAACSDSRGCRGAYRYMRVTPGTFLIGWPGKGHTAATRQPRSRNPEASRAARDHLFAATSRMPGTGADCRSAELSGLSILGILSSATLIDLDVFRCPHRG